MRLSVGMLRFVVAVCMAVAVLLGTDVSVCTGAENDDSKTSAREPIAADFSNVRGLNYIASYAPSDVAMWRFYDRDQIDRELALIRGLGCDSVRVWLAWVDVMSYHPYGIFPKNRQVWTDTARDVSERHGGKPILVTEAGGPGFGQRYEECLEFFEAERIGFYLFEAMIGTNRFRNVTGFCYPDGSVRELEPVRAFQELARRQGIEASADYPVRPGEPPYPIAGAKEVTELIFDWDSAELTPKNYSQREGLLRWTLISLAWGGALKDHIEEVQALKKKADAAQQAGDMEGLKKVMSKLAGIAAGLLVKHEFVEAEPAKPPFGDFSWMHGVNYTPSYAATDVETWLKYDPAVIDREFKLAERVGLNCVRVFLQSLVYGDSPERFLKNFDDFLAIADRHGLKVMPILFDSCFGVSPSLESRHMWVANPGPDRMSEEHFEALDAYARAVVTAHVGDERVALWDVMNEPSVTVLSLTEEGKAQVWAFVAHYCNLVRKLDPTHAITVGVASSDNSKVVDLVDVLSCHSYAPTREELRERFSQTESQAREAGKPWIVSECCAPGWGSPYEVVFPELREFGVGHTAWELVIGRNQFAPISGLFYPDGTVRRLSSIEAVVGGSVPGLSEKPDEEGVPIARQRAGRLAEYVRFLARDEVTESTWRERNTGVRALVAHNVYGDEAASVLGELDAARAAYASGDRTEAFRSVKKLLEQAAGVLTEREKAAPQ